MSGWLIVYFIACFVQSLFIGEFTSPDIGVWQHIGWYFVVPVAFTAGLEIGKGR